MATVSGRCPALRKGPADGIRQLVREAAEMPEADGWQRTNELAVQIFASGDAVEGATAFAEKRKPVWKSQ